MWKIIAQNITKTFNQRTIFRDLSFQIESGSSLAITGANGSGKTTLVRIISQLIRPNSGNITFYKDEQQQERNQLYAQIGLVGPYLQLYNNLTALENYTFFAKIRGLKIDIEQFKSLMKKVGLGGRELDELRTYSSGMLQRMKYACALLHNPEILILDEPTSNLDEKGSDMVYSIIEKQKKNKLLILATNNSGEIKFGDQQIQLSA